MSKGKAIIKICAVVAAFALVLGCIYVGVESSKNASYKKTIYLEVEALGDSTSYKFETDGVYLLDALLSGDFCEGRQKVEGYILSRVGEITAGEDEHWRIYIEGEPTAKKPDKIKLQKNGSYALKLVKKGE